MRKQMFFIYNPKAGKGQIRSNLLDIIDVFVKAGYEVTAYPTQSAGDAVRAVRERRAGYDMVVCSGGMSVDPDDRTPGGIRDTGARVVTYGAPVLPGAMLLIAYYEKERKRIPILGLPGCVMYAKRTVFDLVLPRIMADDEIFAEEVAAYGEGGLCLNCKVCTFPNCGFGK